MAVKKDPRTLELAEPFVSLFPVDPTTLELVKDSIRERGFQADKPILVWRDAFGEKDRSVVVDGHTRLRAALDLRLPEISTTVRQFKDVDAAITAAIGEQVQRRNLNREQIAAFVISVLPLLDEKKGGLRTRTAKELAQMLGVSKPTIDRARSLLDSGRPELVAAVKDGRMSLLAAWEESLVDLTPVEAPEGPQEPTGGSEEPYRDPDEVPPADGHRPPSEPRKRMHATSRERAAAKRRGDPTAFWTACFEISKAASALETVEYFELGEISLAEGDEDVLSDFDLLNDLLDDLLRLQDFQIRVMDKIQVRIGEQGIDRKLAALRTITVANGASAEEAATAKRKADRLKRRLRGKLSRATADA